MRFSRQEYWVAMPSSRGIFPTQGPNSGLPHCRQILYHLSHQESPRILEWVAISFSRGSSRSRDWTHISQVPCTARHVCLFVCLSVCFTTSTTWGAHGVGNFIPILQSKNLQLRETRWPIQQMPTVGEYRPRSQAFQRRERAQPSSWAASLFCPKWVLRTWGTPTFKFKHKTHLRARQTQICLTLSHSMRNQVLPLSH